MVEFHEFVEDWHYRPDPLRTIVYRGDRRYPLTGEVLAAARKAGVLKEPANVRSRNRTSTRRPYRAQG